MNPTPRSPSCLDSPNRALKRPAPSDDTKRKRTKAEESDRPRDDAMDSASIDADVARANAPRPGQQTIPIDVQLAPLAPGQLVAIDSSNPFAELPRELIRRIIDFCRPPTDFTAPCEDRILQRTGRSGYQLACVDRALKNKFEHDPDYISERAALQWLWTLNRLGEDVRHFRLRRIDISKLIDSGVKVTLSCQPRAPRMRTDLLTQRLVLCCEVSLFETLLCDLFEKLKSGVVIDALTFIDLRHLALSALSAAVRCTGFDSYLTQQVVRHTTANGRLDALPPAQQAAFWAELVVHNRRSPALEKTPAWQALVRLCTTHGELADFWQFVQDVCLFMDGPPQDGHSEAMIVHLEADDTSWTPSNVELLNRLAGLAGAPEGIMPLSPEQGARVRRILVHYLEALIGLLSNLGPGTVDVSFAAIPADLLFSAFSELTLDGKLKLIGIMLRVDPPRGFYDVKELKTWWPTIESTLSDGSMLVSQRRGLVDSLLNRLNGRWNGMSSEMARWFCDQVKRDTEERRGRN